MRPDVMHDLAVASPVQTRRPLGGHAAHWRQHGARDGPRDQPDRRARDPRQGRAARTARRVSRASPRRHGVQPRGRRPWPNSAGCAVSWRRLCANQLLNGTATTEDTIVCQLCELLWADHACLWMLPAQPDEAHDWSRQTIVSEAVAEYYPLVGYSTCTPPEEWSRACLEPILEAEGAVPHSPPPFNAPKEGDAGFRPRTRVTWASRCAGGPATAGLLLLERYGTAAAPASPWSDFDRELLEDASAILGLALENNLLSAQSAERASYLTNMLNSLDVAVMVIEQPPAPVPAVVSLVNRSFCELFGVEHAQVEGSSYLQFMDLVQPILPDWEAQLAIIEDLLADPTAERIDEITLIANAPDAVPTHLHRFATPARDAQGNIFGRMFFFRDITYDKEVERQLVHSQKMDSIGTLAGGVAHDFNNLLTTILGYAELLKRELKDNESSGQKLLQIEKSANRAAELTGQLLAFSRRHPTVLHIFNLNELVAETMDMIRSTVPASIDVQFQPVPNDLPNVEADSTQIQQVLINLILNARDALSGNGQITISTRIGSRHAGADRPARRRGGVCHPGGRGQRRGHPERRAAPHLRAVLHDQGSRQGHGPGAGDGVRHHQEAQRLHRGDERAGRGDEVFRVPAGDGQAQRRSTRVRPARTPCANCASASWWSWSWTTSRTCGIFA